MPQSSNRVNIRFDEGVMENLKQMAFDLNMNWSHFASISLAIGAKHLHRQMTAFESIPTETWQAIAVGYAQAMEIDEEKMLKLMLDAATNNPEQMEALARAMDTD